MTKLSTLKEIKEFGKGIEKTPQPKWENWEKEIQIMMVKSYESAFDLNTGKLNYESYERYLFEALRVVFSISPRTSQN